MRPFSLGESLLSIGTRDWNGSMTAVIDVAEIVVSLGSLRFRLDVEWL